MVINESDKNVEKEEEHKKYPNTKRKKIEVSSQHFQFDNDGQQSIKAIYTF